MRFLRRGKEHAPTIDLLVAGLGNPGREYERTRHNVGWVVVDEVARRTDASFRSKFNGRLAEARLDQQRLALLKPETYMNESGRSIAAALRFFKVAPTELLVVHDDVDLEPGRLQAREGEGSLATTGCARSRRRSGRRTSCACGSAWVGRGAVTLARSPTTSCRRSRTRSTWTP